MSEYWMDPENVTRYDQSPDLWTAVRREQIDIIASIIEKRHRPGGAILDLGIGTGQIEEQLLMRISDARVVGVDYSPLVLDRARTRLRGFSDRCDLIQHDYHELGSLELGSEGFEASVSYDILHHVDDTRKIEIFRFIHDHLLPGGVFLFADMVNMEEEGLDELHGIVWDRQEDKANTKTGVTFEEFIAHLRECHHHPTTLDRHLELMRSAGFRCACLHQYLDHVLIAGLRS